MSDEATDRDTALPSSPEALEAAIEARRAHLSGTLDELSERLKPANLAHEAKDAASTKVHDLTHDPQGNLLKERVAAVGAAVVALVALVVVVKARRRR